MYIKKSYYCGKVLEVEKIQTFRYKSKHTVRAPQTNPTPEAQAVVNERNSIKNLARLMAPVLDLCKRKQSLIPTRSEGRPCKIFA